MANAWSITTVTHLFIPTMLLSLWLLALLTFSEKTNKQKKQKQTLILSTQYKTVLQ